MATQGQPKTLWHLKHCANGVHLMLWCTSCVSPAPFSTPGNGRRRSSRGKCAKQRQWSSGVTMKLWLDWATLGAILSGSDTTLPKPLLGPFRASSLMLSLKITFSGTFVPLFGEKVQCMDITALPHAPERGKVALGKLGHCRCSEILGG